MKAVIFAGGVGTRLWPLSRKKSPKQFEKIVGNKSTLQLAVERLSPLFKPEDIYISTGKDYVKTVKKQISSISYENIIGEPEKKDVGPAVCLVMGMLSRKNPDEPVVILWSDHMIKKEKPFLRVIKSAGEIIKKKPNKIIFIGHKPRFASENLGWIEFGKKVFENQKINFYEFKSFKYRPDRQLVARYFKAQNFSWNLGYFVTTPRFIYSQFKRFTPRIYELVETILDSKNNFTITLDREYTKMPEISFDNAIIEQLDPQSAYVINEDIGWSDVGAWEALKDALQKKIEENITQGNVLLEDSSDNLVYNYEAHKMLVGIDLDEHIIINTKDVLLVAKKTSSSKVKKLVKKLEESENNHLV